MNLFPLFAFQDGKWLEKPEFFFQDEIICTNGKVLKKYTWHSDFERSLQITLKDPSKAKRIDSLYTSCLLPSVAKNSKLQQEVENWIVGHAGFLGATPVEYKASFATNFRLEYLLNNSPYKEGVVRFFRELQLSEEQEALPKKIASTQKRVAILTSKMGGGHVSVARAIKEELDRQFETTIVDVDTLSDESHPLFTITGSFSSVDIYNKLYQQEENQAKIEVLSKAILLLRQFTPDRTLEALKKTLRELQPDIIVSTCVHNSEHAFLASDLALPLIYIHTDFLLHPAALKTMQKVRSTALSFFVPSVECLPSDANEQVDLFGFPLSSVFTRESDPEQLQKIRNGFGIPTGAKVILLMMGKQGAGNLMFENVKQLVLSKPPYPLHIVVICGENSTLKTNIDTLIKNNLTTDSNLSFLIHQSVPQQQLADYYKITELLIGKAGGSTTAEVRQMGIRLLECGSHPWEQPNIQYLLKHAVCRQMDIQSPLLPQTINYLETAAPKDFTDIVDWKTLIKQKIVERIQQKPQNILVV